MTPFSMFHSYLGEELPEAVSRKSAGMNATNWLHYRVKSRRSLSDYTDRIVSGKIGGSGS